MIAVIGAGRIGTALHQRDPAVFGLVDRHSGDELLERDPGEAILVAVRNDDLPAVLERVPARRRADLVFIQNGMLRPWLREQGLADATRGLLFMAVPARGAPIEPGGESPFVGAHAPTLVEAFRAVGLPAALVDAQAFAEVELEKLIWNCAFGLLCEALGCDVGTVVEDHGERLGELVAELLAVGGPALGVELDLAALVDRLSAYSRSIAGYRGAVKEWRWRNGWFVETARERGVATPVHDRLLAALGRS
ncbi:2-dehydropantoate 2-reductase [Enhygromyxa salina]|uniref:2-dehydropantoate 2-reductase n=1 Tax=Enhygromyxa salina TaxID=215803 RepID=A0A2S9YAK9_9BACT|nr:ketopantoate reductase C-terminal domain-containing protein [Enhygromyxa salina]PRQ02147.1 2-dehydropantoate 2-reductase [Enhygromyxa salina]